MNFANAIARPRSDLIQVLSFMSDIVLPNEYYMSIPKGKFTLETCSKHL